MNVPIRLRRPMIRLALLSAATLAVGLFLPVYSTASQGPITAEAQAALAEERATRSEERATRAEERAARRAHERATRAQEREARRAARASERIARHKARGVSGTRRRGDSSNGASSESVSRASDESGGELRASRQRPCHLTVAATVHRITVGETVTVIGKLLCPSGLSAAEVPVTIYRHQPATALTLLGTGTTGADGSFQLTPAAFATNSILYVRARQARGARTTVRVAPEVTLNAAYPGVQTSDTSGESRSRVRARATFTGTVSPVDAGALVALQVAYDASGGQWHSVAFGRVGSDGNYSIAHAFRTPGEASIRTIVHAAKLNMAVAISESLRYEISQPQNPDLTIQTSADPIAYGQSVTISGVAAGAQNQPVTLLARTKGNALAVIAKGTTDASGHYAFTQEPLQMTYYRVSDATARSTALFESVGFALAATAIPNTLHAGQQLTFSGTLAPAHAGQIVYLERGYASGIGFRVVDTGTVDAASQYTIVHTFATAGTSIMRIRVPTDGERHASVSTPLPVTVMR
jgi:hypothetical protein